MRSILIISTQALDIDSSSSPAWPERFDVESNPGMTLRSSYSESIAIKPRSTVGPLQSGAARPSRIIHTYRLVDPLGRLSLPLPAAAAPAAVANSSRSATTPS